MQRRSRRRIAVGSTDKVTGRSLLHVSLPQSRHQVLWATRIVLNKGGYSTISPDWGELGKVHAPHGPSPFRVIHVVSSAKSP
jgi:hypothetical protein